MIVSENIPGQRCVKEEGGRKVLPVPGKAVVAVVAKHCLAVLARVWSCPRNIVRKFADKVMLGKNLEVVLSLDFLFPWEKSHKGSELQKVSKKPSKKGSKK